MSKNSTPKDLASHKQPSQKSAAASDAFVSIDGARCYLVGGAVRDQLLDIASKDKDWLVVGATPEIMLEQGFKQVGNDFPVFLHPHSHEEYALARTERKSGNGYQGFEFSFAQSTTIEEDLIRRDLSINAIAMDDSGKLIDPYGGIEDLNNRLLKHVSPAFKEDPLRVLRVARFAAQLAPFGFTLAAETRDLMQEIADAGELEFLQAERIWQETSRALCSDHPDVFIQTLRDCGALKVIYPELDALFGVPQTAKYHPEIDSGIHTLMVMQQSVALSDKLSVRFAAMSHDFGKGTTPKGMLPRHIGHEQRSYDLLQKFYKRIPVPKDAQDLANKVAKFHLHAHRAFELRAETVLKLLKQIDAFRKPQVFENYLLSCLADSRGRTGFETKAFPQIDYLRACFNSANEISVDTIRQQFSAKQSAATEAEIPQGKELGQAIDQARTKNIELLKKHWKDKEST